MSGTTPRRSGPGGGALTKKAPFFVRAPPPSPLRRGVVPLTGYRGMSHALFFRLRESSNPRPKGHIEMGSTLTTNFRDGFNKTRNLKARKKISVSTDISVLEFYGYIGYIGDISLDIFT